MATLAATIRTSPGRKCAHCDRVSPGKSCFVRRGLVNFAACLGGASTVEGWGEIDILRDCWVLSLVMLWSRCWPKSASDVTSILLY
jgi:hypothetical protein